MFRQGAGIYGQMDLYLQNMDQKLAMEPIPEGYQRPPVEDHVGKGVLMWNQRRGEIRDWGELCLRGARRVREERGKREIRERGKREIRERYDKEREIGDRAREERLERASERESE